MSSVLSRAGVIACIHTIYKRSMTMNDRLYILLILHTSHTNPYKKGQKAQFEMSKLVLLVKRALKCCFCPSK